MEAIKIKLEKTEKLNGQVWYHVFAGAECVEAFIETPASPKKALEDATLLFNTLVGRAESGYPKTETILSFDNTTSTVKKP